MTPDEIIEFYDLNPNLTFAELSRMTGYSVEYLKKLLMGKGE